MIRLALRVARSDSELVLADLLELAPDGVEEAELEADDGAEPQVEYAVYGPPGELPRLPDLQALAGGVAVQVSSSEVPDDWPERWKRFHRPILIEGMAASLHVRPPWEPPSEHAGAIEIVIDPAQAFGTGAHATTRLCLELLLELAAHDSRRGPVLDVGAGSGILAIAAAKLGYGPVLALDSDRLSLEAIAENARRAGVEAPARLFDLRSQALPFCELEAAGESVVLANLLRPLLLELAGGLEQPPGHLIASGLLRAEADEVARAFARLGLQERRRSERGDWIALWLSCG